MSQTKKHSLLESLMAETVHLQTTELLHHFNCGSCKGWWSIGDWVPIVNLYCPHCGMLGKVKMTAAENLSPRDTIKNG